MDTKGIVKAAMLICMMMVYSAAVLAGPPGPLTHRDSVFLSQMRFKVDAGVEYMAPYDASRLVRTVSANV